MGAKPVSYAVFNDQNRATCVKTNRFNDQNDVVAQMANDSNVRMEYLNPRNPSNPHICFVYDTTARWAHLRCDKCN